MEIPSFLKSSVDPEKLGLTVKGILIGVVPVILLVSGLAGADLGQSDFNELIEALVNLVVAGATTVSALMVAWGLIRKILVKLGVVKPRV